MRVCLALCAARFRLRRVDVAGFAQLDAVDAAAGREHAEIRDRIQRRVVAGLAAGLIQVRRLHGGAVERAAPH